MLCSSKLCFQLTMTQERTQYFTQGEDGKKLLKQGPTLPVFRNLKVIKSKCFSLDNGAQPRDILRRRVRTAEFYVVPAFQAQGPAPQVKLPEVELYDESSDNWAKLVFPRDLVTNYDTQIQVPHHGYNPAVDNCNWLLLRPNIEHYMLGVIIGRGGIEHLGACFWGQTELSVFDDGQHGVWGMTYKCKKTKTRKNTRRRALPCIKNTRRRALPCIKKHTAACAGRALRVRVQALVKPAGPSR